MWTSSIGTNAGKLWNILHEAGETNLSALKKRSRLNDRELYLALGWLTREGKIRYAQEKTAIKVSLQ
ncbi:MAG: hypothetical protein EG824_14020 [Deltaproteobacteria bacterium]|nr:hypothetical protein [Deltaproteobacteria bacterium]